MPLLNACLRQRLTVDHRHGGGQHYCDDFERASSCHVGVLWPICAKRTPTGSRLFLFVVVTPAYGCHVLPPHLEDIGIREPGTSPPGPPSTLAAALVPCRDAIHGVAARCCACERAVAKRPAHLQALQALGFEAGANRRARLAEPDDPPQANAAIGATMTSSSARSSDVSASASAMVGLTSRRTAPCSGCAARSGFPARRSAASASARRSAGP